MADDLDRSRIVLSYDGTAFAGWAAQPGLRTVEHELTRALATVLPAAPNLTVAGRTDRGVHAEGQVVSHPGPAAWVDSLNAVLPDDISVSESVIADPGFDARKDATSRAYCYRVLASPGRPITDRHRILWWPRPLDPDLLDHCAGLLSGEPDLTAFTPTQSYHTRFRRKILSARWLRGPGGRLDFLIEADSFMRHMNRTLVGTMLDIAAGVLPLELFPELLQGRPREMAGSTAPARGLTMIGVGYGSRVLTEDGTRF
jgi:tRNA pseudouridine38-40 synthase